MDVVLRPSLREINWGCADGQLVQKMAEEWGAEEHKVKQLYPERKVRWDYLPVFEGAETFNALLNRNLEELKTIAAAHEGETVLTCRAWTCIEDPYCRSKRFRKEYPLPS